MCSITVITSLFKGEQYLDGYFTAVGEIKNKYEIEILLMHNAPNDAELTIIKKWLPQYPFIRHIIVAEREGLYSSWNNAIKLSKGKYIAVWNVDDIRTPDSLVLQKAALDNSSAVMCYGDFYGTDTYGPFKERLYKLGEYERMRRDALRIHIIGCFPMWRKEIHQHIGYFDEQFKLVSDYEFQIRVALKYDLIKASSFLGYYLENVNAKLSSNRFLQHKERTVVELRYKIYDKILLHILPFVLEYKLNHFLNFGEWIKLSENVEMPGALTLKTAVSFITAPFSYCFWIMKKVYNAVHHIFFQ